MIAFGQLGRFRVAAMTVGPIASPATVTIRMLDNATDPSACNSAQSSNSGCTIQFCDLSRSTMASIPSSSPSAETKPLPPGTHLSAPAPLFAVKDLTKNGLDQALSFSTP